MNVADNDTTTALLVEQKPAELILYRDEQFLRFDTEKVKLITFLRKRRSRHLITTVNLLQVSADSLNSYMSKPIVEVIAQSEQELYYFEGPIMKKGNELTAEYPNAPRFQQLAIDNTETEYQLKQLDLQQKAEQLAYHSKLSELERHRAELYAHTNKTDLSDYEEGKRRERIRELTARIDAFENPEPVNMELYRVQRQLLEHKLRETAHLNASLLIWQAQENRN